MIVMYKIMASGSATHGQTMSLILACFMHQCIAFFGEVQNSFTGVCKSFFHHWLVVVQFRN